MLDGACEKARRPRQAAPCTLYLRKG